MLLRELVATSAVVARSPGRKAKIAELAALLARVPPAETEVAVSFLCGDLTQRQIGVGYAALAGLHGPGAAPDTAAADGAGLSGAGRPGPLSLADADAAFSAIGALAGTGSQAQRRGLLAGLFGRADDAERDFLGRLLAGDLGQGALEGIVTEAVAVAAGVPADEIRAAVQMAGSLPAVAAAALRAAAGNGTTADPGAVLAAVRAFTLRVGQPVRPMLAAAAPSLDAALDRISPAAVEWKIDGIRIQIHRDGQQVRVFSRTLEDITARMPEIVAAVLALPASTIVLDAEAIALYPDGRPRPFQVTAARAARQGGTAAPEAPLPLTAFLFDLLHADGTDLTGQPAAERFRLLAGLVPAAMLIPRLVTGDRDEAAAFFGAAITAGHEGVVMKSPDAAYRAGRRGAEWIKVKPRHTLDLVILAAEWGHGRRTGLLSNLHLGARDPASGGFVMLGKTFKGLTDQMLAWQTARLLELAEPPPGSTTAAPGSAAAPGGTAAPGDARPPFGVVRVRPELVAEIAVDGVQESRRYPGGVALRFARVLRYRDDKTAAEADTIDSVRALWPHAAG